MLSQPKVHVPLGLTDVLKSVATFQVVAKARGVVRMHKNKKRKTEFNNLKPIKKINLFGGKIIFFILIPPFISRFKVRSYGFH